MKFIMENIALITIKVPTYTPVHAASIRPAASSSSSKRSKDRSQSKMMLVLPPMPVNSTMARSEGPPIDSSSLGVKFVSAGMAGCIADMVTFPLDTAKVRLQIQGESIVGGAMARSTAAVAGHAVFSRAATAAAPKGLVGMMASITRTEGVRALYSGLAPGLQRQMCFASVRIGLYDVVKQGYSNMLNVDPNNKNIGLRILAGITTGGAAVLVAQPTDVVKVRMQAQGNKAGPKRYTSSMMAYRKIALEDGARGLWRGTVPNMSRNAIVNCTELVSYDLIKEALLSRRLLSDNIPCHFVSAVGAGFFTTVFASPVDVLKTRFMNSSDGAYKGVLDCAASMYREGGVKTFYKGAVPSFLRFGPWNVVMFISYEQLKKQLGSIDTNTLPAMEVKSTSQSRYM